LETPLTKLGELAGDLSLDVVFKKRTTVFFAQRDLGAAFDEGGDVAISLA
jgi:hypothetical protein